MTKVKLTIQELAEMANREVSAMYRLKKSRPEQYKLMVIGALTLKWEEARVDEIMRML